MRYCYALIMLCLSGCSQDRPQPNHEVSLDVSHHSVVTSASLLMEQKSYGQATRLLEDFQAENPLSPYIKNVEKMLIDCYYHQGDFAMMLAASDRFLYEHLDDPHRDYIAFLKISALYQQASGYPYSYIPIDRAYRDVSAYKQAFIAAKDFFNQYPQSPYRASVGDLLPEMKNTIARSYFYDGELLRSRQETIGAVRAYQTVLDNFQDSPYAQDAEKSLHIMFKDYQLKNVYFFEEKS